MKKNLLGEKAISELKLWRKRDVILPIIEKLEARISGKRGAEDARDRFFEAMKKIYLTPKNYPSVSYPTPEACHKARLARWKKTSAEALAGMADLRSDEHGSWRGNHLSVYGMDFVGHWESAAAPYWDMGGEGLGLVSCTRTRVYAGNKWGNSSVSTTFLVGRNEAGTYFSHPVSPGCSTVEDALQWIWSGKAHQIIQRQGDVALIGGNGGPKMPSYLPRSHKVQGDIIVHDTHPDLPMPAEKGQRIIVGRRAAERASEATRD